MIKYIEKLVPGSSESVRPTPDTLRDTTLSNVVFVGFRREFSSPIRLTESQTTILAQGGIIDSTLDLPNRQLQQSSSDLLSTSVSSLAREGLTGAVSKFKGLFNATAGSAIDTLRVFSANRLSASTSPTTESGNVIPMKARRITPPPSIA